MRTAKTLIRLADTQADPSLRWAQMVIVLVLLCCGPFQNLPVTCAGDARQITTGKMEQKFKTVLTFSLENKLKSIVK